jgi:hypothetical protein
MRGGGRGGGGR